MTRIPNPFYRLASAVTAADLCRPCRPALDYDFGCHDVELHDEDDVPIDADDIWLVDRDGEIVGCWSPTMCDDGETVGEQMSPIALSYLVSSNTTYHDLAAAFTDASRYYVLVLEGQTIIGWIPFVGLFSRLGQICLMSLAFHLEAVAERLCETDPEAFFSVLPPNRQEKATKEWEGNPRWKKRRKRSSSPTASQLIRATNFIDKKTMVARNAVPPGWSSKQVEEVFDVAEDVRNYCAHNALATDFFSGDFSGLWNGTNRKKFGLFLTRTQELTEAIQLLIVQSEAE